MNRHAFTIVEIMMVVAIIGVLTAIAIPKIVRLQMNAREQTAINHLKVAVTGLEAYRSTQPLYPPGTQWKACLFPQGTKPVYLSPIFYMDCNNTTNAAVPPNYTGGLLPNGYVCHYKGDAAMIYNEWYTLKLRPKSNNTGSRVFVASNLFGERHCLGLETDINNLLNTGPNMATLDQKPKPCP